MIFYVPLMYCEYRDVLLLKSIYLIQRPTASWDSAFTGSQDALFIQPSALELYVNAKMCDPCTICRMAIQMVTAGTRNSRRFNVSFPCHAAGIPNCHAMPFSLYPPMLYSQASEHTVSDGLTKTMLLIGNHLVADVFQPKMGCSLSLSGMQRKIFIDRRNRTNYYLRARTYFLI